MDKSLSEQQVCVSAMILYIVRKTGPSYVYPPIDIGSNGQQEAQVGWHIKYGCMGFKILKII